MITGKWLYVSGREQGACAGMSTIGYTCMGLWDITEAERGWQLGKVYIPMVSVWSIVFGVRNGRLETNHLLTV